MLSAAQLKSWPEVCNLAQLLLPRDAKQTHEIWRNLYNNLESTEIIQLLDHHGITELLASQPHDIPELMTLVKNHRAQAIASQALNTREFEQTVLELSNKKLDKFLLFKGGALAHSLYPQPWLRSRADWDIWVDTDQKALFSEVLASLGYQQHLAIEGDWVSHQRTFTKPLGAKGELNIDLHWRVSNRYRLARCFDFSACLARSQTVRLNQIQVKTPDIVDSLLLAAQHRLGHHASRERLIWLYDILLLVQTLEEAEWRALERRSKEQQLANLVLDALLTVEMLFNARLDETAISNLKASAQQERRTAIFIRRRLPEWRLSLDNLFALPGLGARLSFVRDNLFPAPDYMRQRMHTNSLVKAHSKRWLRGVRRLLR